MIIASTGEVFFEQGLSLLPHVPLRSIQAAVQHSMTHWGFVSARKLPIQGWMQFEFGVHKSNHGEFLVEVVTGPEHRIEGVFLSHHHSFYDSRTPNDAERRVFHDGVIATDLLGQREFSWGHVFCRVDGKANRDWLVLIYNPFSEVPLHAREVYRRLFAREAPPSG